jgi:PAS domain S-box-containing protein
MLPEGREDEGPPPASQRGVVAEAGRRAMANLVLGAVTEGVWLIDADARTVFANKGLADLLGYTEAEMIDKSVFAFVGPERRPITEKNLTLRQLGLADREELQLCRKDGSRVWVLGSSSPVFDAKGRYAGALAVIVDLTVQKQREQALRARVADLEAELTANRTPPYREPFRTAIVLAACGGFVATVALTSVAAIASALFGVPASGTADLGG